MKLGKILNLEKKYEGGSTFEETSALRGTDKALKDEVEDKVKEVKRYTDIADLASFQLDALRNVNTDFEERLHHLQNFH